MGDLTDNISNCETMNDLFLVILWNFHVQFQRLKIKSTKVGLENLIYSEF